MSATPLVARLRAGSKSAFAGLFSLYFRRQARFAEASLPFGRPGLADGEDIALSVFLSLWREVTAGRFDGRLGNTAGFLGILSLLTRQKVRRAARYDRARIRDVRRTCDLPDDAPLFLPSEVSSQEPELPGLTPLQQRIARMTWDGWQREEIARDLRCSVRTVYRELTVIRAVLVQRQRDAA